jgi:hypothetical protein
MIGSSMSVSVLSAQQLQAQRDAQAARARADRLQTLSRQAQDEANRATARSQDLSRQSEASRRDATQAEQRAQRSPARQTIPAPERAGTPAQATSPGMATPTTAQRIGQDILARAGGYAPPTTAQSATQAYQRVQAATGMATASSAAAAPNRITPGGGLSALV